MKKAILLFSLSLCLTSILTGCGSDYESPVAVSGTSSVFPASSNYKSGNCGSDVIADYNSAVLDCKYMRTNADVAQCKSKMTKFKNKYPGINCKAERGYGLDKETFTVTERHIDEILESL